MHFVGAALHYNSTVRTPPLASDLCCCEIMPPHLKESSITIDTPAASHLAVLSLNGVLFKTSSLYSRESLMPSVVCLLKRLRI